MLIASNKYYLYRCIGLVRFASMDSFRCYFTKKKEGLQPWVLFPTQTSLLHFGANCVGFRISVLLALQDPRLCSKVFLDRPGFMDWPHLIPTGLANSIIIFALV